MSITLKSNDAQSFQLDADACSKSKYLQSQIDSGKSDILLEDIKGEVLQLVVDYLTHYKGVDPEKIPEVLSSNDLSKQLPQWDTDFIDKVSFENTFHLINAGVLLELDHLHDLACAKIAAFMKGKTPEEVNKEFTIECQLTQEEAKELGLDAN
jgi:S-phase kinase-associated protein 1